ncbi:MAG: hypothetical protein ACFFD1_09445 [Candidatus Thorarchaeota archaeon]
MLNHDSEFIEFPWLPSSLINTLNSSKSLKSVFLLNKGEISWFETKDINKKARNKKLLEIAFQGFTTLWEVTFKSLTGSFFSFEVEGSSYRFYFYKIKLNLWLGFEGSIIEGISNIIQQIVINGLEDFIILDKVQDNQFLGLITSEGYHLWLKSKYPDFILEDVLSSCFSAIERIQLELKIGSIDECVFQTTKGNKLEVKMNRTNELSLTNFDENIHYDSSLYNLFYEIIRSNQRINFSEHLSQVLQKYTEREQNPLLEEMRATPIESEITDDELISLIGFDEALLERMEKTITAIVGAYNIREISIPYLGQKIFRLPSIVVQLSLSYLIGQGRLQRAHLKMSNPSVYVPDILELELFSYSEDEYKQIVLIRDIFDNIMVSVNEFISELNNYIFSKPKTKIFNEIESIRQNTDTYPIFTLIRDIHEYVSRITEYYSMIEMRTKNLDNSDSLTEKGSLENKIEFNINALFNKLELFQTTLKSIARYLFRFIPNPQDVRYNETDQYLNIIFRCSHNKCQKMKIITIKSEIFAWRKFLMLLPEKKVTPNIEIFIKPLKECYENIPRTLNRESIEAYSWNLDDFVLTNEERELIINTVFSKIDSDTNKEWIKEINTAICEICDNWFCQDHYNFDQFKCSLHQKLKN